VAVNTKTMQTSIESGERPLTGEKVQRIVDAMRHCVAERGIAGATFEHVSRRAGVSRGLLHYYFGTKERLLAEVVKRDCDIRMERLDEALDGVESTDALIAALVWSLKDMVSHAPGFVYLLFELCVVARRHEDIADEVAELHARVRGHLAAHLADCEERGVVALGGPADAVADVLFSLADGLALRMVSEPARDHGATLAAAETAARALLRAP
jgi:AcrR family transcriptional regulator